MTETIHTHVHIFSLGRNSRDTYFATMREAKPSCVYLVCDKEIYDIGTESREILKDLIQKGKIAREPTLDETLRLMRNSGQSFDNPLSDTEILKDKISILESLIPSEGVKNQKESSHSEDRRIQLEEELGISALDELHRDGYAILKTQELIYECQGVINACYGWKEERVIDTRRKMLQDIMKHEDAVLFLINNIPGNNADEQKLDSEFYSDYADGIKDNYKRVDIGENETEHFKVISKRDSSSVRDEITDFLRTEISSDNPSFSMNISAGRNQFILSLFALGSWLNATVYLSPRKGAVQEIPLPNKSERIKKSDGTEYTLKQHDKAYLEVLCKKFESKSISNRDEGILNTVIYGDEVFQNTIKKTKNDVIKRRNNSIEKLCNEGLINRVSSSVFNLTQEGVICFQKLKNENGTGRYDKKYTLEEDDRALLNTVKDMLSEKTNDPAKWSDENISLKSISDNPEYKKELKRVTKDSSSYKVEGKKALDILIDIGFADREKIEGETSYMVKPTEKGMFYYKIMMLMDKKGKKV